MMFTAISLLLIAHHVQVLALTVNTVYFQATGLSVFEYYPNVQLFEVTVPQSVNALQWDFLINRNTKSCPPSLIKFHYQHGGYPLVQENNQTFPAHYRLARTAAANFTLLGQAMYSINVTSPLAGRWFAGAYVDRINDHKVVKNLGAETCQYSLQMNVSMYVEQGVQEIAINEVLRLKQDADKQVYSFPLEENIWMYRVEVECGGEGDCPLVMQVADGFIPQANFSTRMISCENSTTSCSIQILSPRLDQLQYISIVRKNSTKLVHYTLTIETAEFGSPAVQDHITAASIRSDKTHKKKSKPKVSEPTDQKNDTRVEKKKPHITTHAILKPLKLSPQQNTNETTMTLKTPKQEERDKDIDGNKDSAQKQGSDNNTEDDKNPETPEEDTDPETPTEDDDNQASILYDLQSETADRRRKRKKRSVDSTPGIGQRITRLDRLENPDAAFGTAFSVNALVGENQLNLGDEALAAITWTMLPNKDQGGTLYFKAQLNSSDVDTSKENLTISGCLSPNRLTVNETSVTCSADFAFQITTSQNSTTLLFPYPEPGTWFLLMSLQCWNGQEKQKCSEPYYPILFEVTSTPCDQGQCGVIGTCNRYYTGSIFYSACSCEAKYRGYGCTDDHETLSEHQQLADTLLLVLSNLLFLPSIGVATARRCYTEALVYLANMIFSSLYHACDMGPWSRYRLCVMPYHVLSYCDFFASIMSIWVTLVAAAAMGPVLTSLAHMGGALALAMAVEWHVHGLWHNVVPIVVGLLLVAISWGVRCRRLKHCYPTQKREWLCLLPGLALAGMGFATFAFLETDANYPYTHSAWHVAMALSICFLLPNRKREPCSIVCEDSNSSSFELDYPSESVNLVPANEIL